MLFDFLNYERLEIPGYQELTAVVTEISAPNLDGPTDITGERHVFIKSHNGVDGVPQYTSYWTVKTHLVFLKFVFLISGA